MASLIEEISGLRIKVIHGAGVRTPNFRRPNIPAPHDVYTSILLMQSNFFAHVSAIMALLLDKEFVSALFFLQPDDFVFEVGDDHFVLSNLIQSNFIFPDGFL